MIGAVLNRLVGMGHKGESNLVGMALKTIVANLLKDLQVDFVDSDIKSAFRLGSINDKASCQRSIKVQFVSNSFKYFTFKNIQILKDRLWGWRCSTWIGSLKQ